MLSGELTVFDGENYVLPREAMRAAASEVNRGIAGEETGETVSAAVAGGAPNTPIASDGSAEDVQAMLRRQRPDETVIPVGTDSLDGKPTPIAGAGRTLLFDGSAVVNRPGRLIRQGTWWVLVSESDHPDHPEPPLRLLPNQGVEAMVRLSQGRAAGPVFLVSGEVTAFFGENYLLTRAVRHRMDMGNLRP